MSETNEDAASQGENQSGFGSGANNEDKPTSPVGGGDPEDQDAQWSPPSKQTPSKQATMRYVSGANEVNRQKMVDYLSMQRWSFTTLLDLPPVVMLWGVLIVALSVQAHTEASFAVKTSLVSHIETITALPNMGVAPAQVISDRFVMNSSCSCSCAYQASQLCAPPQANVSVAWNGTLSLSTLQTLRDKAFAYASVATVSSLGWDSLRSTDDVMFWLQHGLIPDIWHQVKPETPLEISSLFPGRAGTGSWPQAPQVPPGTLLHWTHIIGGLRLRQYRVKTADCSLDSKIAQRYSQTCYGSTPDVSAFGPGSLSYAEGYIPTSGVPGAYDVLISVDQDVNAVVQEIYYMLMEQHWLGPSSTSLYIQMAVLNAEAVPPLMGFIQIIFTFKASGGLDSLITVQTVAAEPYPSLLYLLLDVCWAFLVIALLLQQLFKAWRHWKGKGKDLRYWTLWNLIDWMVLFASLGLAIFFLVVNQAIRNISALVSDLPQVPPASAGQTAMQAYNTNWSVIIDQMQSVATWWSTFRIATFWYLMLLTALHFKIFRGQPKLAQLATIVAHAAMDLVHFLFFFVIVLFNFAYCGYMIFGLQLADWSTADKAINSSARAMIGDLNVAAMYSVAPVSTMVWYFFLIIAMTLMMFNLILAMTLDHYQSVKASCGSNTGIVLQLRLMVKDQIDRLRDKSWLYCLTCCCRRHDSIPSLNNLLEEFMSRSRLPEKEKAGIRSGVLGAKFFRKEREQDVFSGVAAERITELGEPVDVDMLEMKLDLDYGSHLSEGCLSHASHEYDPEDAKLAQLRQLVNIAEDAILNMNTRLEKCDAYATGNVQTLSTQLMSLETLVHGCLQELVIIAGQAGVPCKSEVKKQAGQAHHGAADGAGLRMVSKLDKNAGTNAANPSKMQGLFLRHGEGPTSGATTSKSLSIDTWHRANKMLDKKGKKLATPTARR